MNTFFLEIINNKIKIFFSIVFSGGFQTYHLVDSSNPSWTWGLLLETNGLVSIPSREHRVCFFQASTTLVDIRVLTYPSLVANRHDGNHHNNNNEVEDLVLTRAEFHQFRE